MPATPSARIVVSADGTRIATSSRGSGPVAVVVAGSFDVMAGRHVEGLADALADRFAVTTYDRRGRGASGGPLPETSQDEVDDLVAVVDASGGHAHVVALCSGSGVVLHALADPASADRIDRTVVFEPPYVPGASREQGRRLQTEIDDRVARGRLSAAVDLFAVGVLGLPRLVTAALRLRRATWRFLLEGAPALVADACSMDGFALPADVFAAIDRPVLVVAGGDSTDRMKIAAQEVVRAVPGSAHTVLQDQHHRVEPTALAPVAARFLTGEAIVG